MLPDYTDVLFLYYGFYPQLHLSNAVNSIVFFIYVLKDLVSTNIQIYNI